MDLKEPPLLRLENLEKNFGNTSGEIPLTFFDERFTTVTATEKLREAGKKAKHQKDIIDQAAALEILRDYLGW
jgi:putative Holliday junction resolvase